MARNRQAEALGRWQTMFPGIPVLPSDIDHYLQTGQISPQGKPEEYARMMQSSQTPAAFRDYDPVTGMSREPGSQNRVDPRLIPEMAPLVSQVNAAFAAQTQPGSWTATPQNSGTRTSGAGRFAQGRNEARAAEEARQRAANAPAERAQRFMNSIPDFTGGPANPGGAFHNSINPNSLLDFGGGRFAFGPANLFATPGVFQPAEGDMDMRGGFRGNAPTYDYRAGGAPAGGNPAPSEVPMSRPWLRPNAQQPNMNWLTGGAQGADMGQGPQSMQQFGVNAPPPPGMQGAGQPRVQGAANNNQQGQAVQNMANQGVAPPPSMNTGGRAYGATGAQDARGQQLTQQAQQPQGQVASPVPTGNFAATNAATDPSQWRRGQAPPVFAPSTNMGNGRPVSTAYTTTGQQYSFNNYMPTLRPDGSGYMPYDPARDNRPQVMQVQPGTGGAATSGPDRAQAFTQAPPEPQQIRPPQQSSGIQLHPSTMPGWRHPLDRGTTAERLAHLGGLKQNAPVSAGTVVPAPSPPEMQTNWLTNPSQASFNSPPKMATAPRQIRPR